MFLLFCLLPFGLLKLSGAVSPAVRFCFLLAPPSGDWWLWRPSVGVVRFTVGGFVVGSGVVLRREWRSDGDTLFRCFSLPGDSFVSNPLGRFQEQAEVYRFNKKRFKFILFLKNQFLKRIFYHWSRRSNWRRVFGSGRSRRRRVDEEIGWRQRHGMNSRKGLCSSNRRESRRLLLLLLTASAIWLKTPQRLKVELKHQRRHGSVRQAQRRFVSVLR